MRCLADRVGPVVLMLALLFVAAVPIAAQNADDWVLGNWKGTLMAGSQELQILYHITRGDDGTLTGTMDVPTQGAIGMPLSTVVVDGQTVTMTFPVPGGGTYEGTLTESGEDIVGTFSQGPASFPMELSRSAEESVLLVRPQEPKPPFPYLTREVTFPNREAGIELAGTLTLPEGAGPFPAVVLVSGSGPQDRNETLLGHKPFLVLADHLARNGVAALRFDDRGVGESTGDFAAATSEDFATDALAAVAYLREQPEVGRGRVGIAGHSEGGLIAPMAANRSDDVAFIIMLAGPGVPGIDILVAQGVLINRVGGASEHIIELNTRIQTGLADIVAAEPDPDVADPLMWSFMRELIDMLPDDVREAAGAALSDATIDQTVKQLNSPWFRFFLHYDPRPVLEHVEVPVLALFGGKDLQVPAELNVPEIEDAFARAGNDDATVRTLPGLNHLFQEADTGSPAEYAQIEQTLSPALLDAVSTWILERFGPS